MIMLTTPPSTIQMPDRSLSSGSTWIKKTPASTYLGLSLLALMTIYSLTLLLFNPTTLVYVWWCSWLTALATGLGTLPFLWFNVIERFYLGLSNAIAAGMMLAASSCLVHEGLLSDSPVTHLMLGFGLGLGFVKLTKTILEQYEDLKVAGLSGLVDARRAILILVVMAVHSISEGVGVGVSFGGSEGHARGTFISSAMAVHNAPEGLAIALVLIPKGMSVSSATLWCILSSLPQPIFAIPAYCFVEEFQSLLGLGLGFAAGAMTFVALAELFIESLEDTKCKWTTLNTILMSFIVMLTLQYVLKD